MSRIALTAAAILAAAVPMSAGAQDISTDYTLAPAGVYTLDPAHTSVTLKVSHFGLSAYTLRLKGATGTFTYDPAHPEAAKLQVELPATAVDTGDPAFDRQVADQVLEASRYPTIRFVSTAVKPSREGRGQVIGDLTLHGQTHPVTLDVIFNGFGAVGPEHRMRMGFTADATVKRSDFGASKYEPMVGDEVSVAIETEFQK